MKEGYAKMGEERRAPCAWSGRGDSNPRPLPWQGSALPLSYSRSKRLMMSFEYGAEGQNRTDDTSIFSAVLYQLSYLGDSTISMIGIVTWECQGSHVVRACASLVGRPGFHRPGPSGFPPSRE